jgi:hypothetical protein
MLGFTVRCLGGYGRIVAPPRAAWIGNVLELCILNFGYSTRSGGFSFFTLKVMYLYYAKLYDVWARGGVTIHGMGDEVNEDSMTICTRGPVQMSGGSVPTRIPCLVRYLP